MINSVSVVNYRGERLDLVLRDPWASGFAVQSIDGLNPPKASINMTELSTKDGSVYNSARLGTRNIVLQLILLDHYTIEQSRHDLYRFLPIKSKVRFEVHTDEEDIYANGYVESNDVKIFSNKETASLSILCPDPYFYSIDDEVVSYTGATGGFEFPFSNEVGTYSLYFGEANRYCNIPVTSYSNFLTGFEMDIHMLGTTGDLTIINEQTAQSMTLYLSLIEEVIGSPIERGDIVHINTNTGQKTVELIRGSVHRNIMACLPRQIDWIKLVPGANDFSILGLGVNNINVYVTTKHIYEGA